MKKFFILFAILFINGLTYAQTSDNSFISQGDHILGGGFLFNRQNLKSENAYQNNSKTTIYNTELNLDYGYTVTDDFVIGLNYDLVIQRNDGDFEDTRNDTHVIGPFVRKYFPITDKLFFNTELNLGYLYTTNQDFGINKSTKSNGVSTVLIAGLTYKLSSKLALTSNIGDISFTHFTFDNIDFNEKFSGETNSFRVRSILSNLSIGAVLLF